MAKIRLITDSASDIPDEDLKRLDIEILSIPIAIDGIEYLERKSFNFEEYYQMLEHAQEIPKTSRVPQHAYEECFEKQFSLGYETLLVVTINAKGSGTYNSALMAKEEFYTKHPQAVGKMEIHVIDSTTYAMAYGWPVMHAAQMALEEQPLQDILNYLADWFSRLEIYLGCYTLKYAAKSGRISSAAAFVGEVLGMRPITQMSNGTTRTVAKVRGDKKLVPGLFEEFKKRFQKDDEVLIVAGSDPQPAKELQALFKKETKKTPPIYQAGACIVTNAGPQMVAFVCKPK